VESEIALIEAYGAKVIALSLNTKGCTLEEARASQQDFRARLGIPVLLPLEEGLGHFVPVLEQLGREEQPSSKNIAERFDKD
jgi:uncharacterized NAD-dependent epimerase/dehydratase family protein